MACLTTESNAGRDGSSCYAAATSPPAPGSDGSGSSTVAPVLAVVAAATGAFVALYM